MSSAVLHPGALDPLDPLAESLPHSGSLLRWVARGWDVLFLTPTPPPAASPYSTVIGKADSAMLEGPSDEPWSATRLAHEFEADLLNRAYREATASVAREDLTRAVSENLGEHAAERFRRFMDYPDGWDHGCGRRLDPGSIDAFLRLLRMTDLPTANVGLFMSPDGNVVINWESPTDDFIEIEIEPETLEVYLGSEDREITVPLDEEAIRALPPFKGEKHGA